MGCCCSALERKVSEKFSEGEIVMKNVGWANLRALSTQSGCKRQGNGALVLTREKIWFRFLCCGDDEVEIPLSDIKMVRIVTMRRVQMLYIQFTSGFVAIAVPEADSWQRQIEDARSKLALWGPVGF